VAVQDKEYVFNIFENRFHPTQYCKPGVWLQEQHSWIVELKVEKYRQILASKLLGNLKESDPMEKILRSLSRTQSGRHYNPSRHPVA
jgi:hypothetical protein